MNFAEFIEFRESCENPKVVYYLVEIDTFPAIVIESMFPFRIALVGSIAINLSE